MNTLYYGDNIDVLKKHIKDETVNLIYLDPLFQSGKNYDIIFRSETGLTSPLRGLRANG